MTVDEISFCEELALLYAISSGLSMRLRMLMTKANAEGHIGVDEVIKALAEMESLRILTRHIHQRIPTS